MQGTAHLTPDLDTDEICEIAMENDDGPLAAINGLLEGLLIRHGGCEATLAAVTAILVKHLPDYVELVKEGQHDAY